MFPYCRSATRSQIISEFSTRLLKEIKLDEVSNTAVAKTQYDIFNSRLSSLEVVIYNVKEVNSGPTCSGLIRLSNTGFLCKSDFLFITVKAAMIEIISNASSVFKSVSSDNVFSASMGGGSSIRLRCAKTGSSKSMNKLGSCSLIMVQNMRSDRVSMPVGFQIINTCTLLAAGCIQTRRGSQRYTRLYETIPVITTCLVCNIFKCQ
jgi:hypothetical protein